MHVYTVWPTSIVCKQSVFFLVLKKNSLFLFAFITDGNCKLFEIIDNCLNIFIGYFIVGNITWISYVAPLLLLRILFTAKINSTKILKENYFKINSNIIYCTRLFTLLFIVMITFCLLFSLVGHHMVLENKLLFLYTNVDNHYVSNILLTNFFKQIKKLF